MVLQATIEAKEAKGYTLNLGFRDGTKGFLKVDKSREFKKGQLVTVTVRKVITASKVAKCEILSESNCGECVQ